MQRKTIKLFIITFTTTSFLLFGHPTSGQTADTIERYVVANVDIFIFSKNYQQHFFNFKKYFTPTRADVDICEKYLKKDINKLSKDKALQDSLKLISTDLSFYKRQYFGYVDEKGDEILFLFGIHQDKIGDFNDWGKELNVLLEAGRYSWSTKYNLTKKKFIFFGLN